MSDISYDEIESLNEEIKQLQARVKELEAQLTTQAQVNCQHFNRNKELEDSVQANVFKDMWRKKNKRIAELESALEETIK